MTGKAPAALLMLCIVLGGLMLGVLFFKACPDRDDAGARADSVLATDTLYVIDTLRQDSAVAALDSVLEAERQRTAHWRARATRAEREGATQVENARVVETQMGLREGMEPADSIAVLIRTNALWRTAALHYKQVAVPAWEAEREAAGRLLAASEAKADTLQGQRDYARARANEVTRAFQEYRDATKPGIQIGPLRLPGWADEAALVVATAAVTCAATC